MATNVEQNSISTTSTGWRSKSPVVTYFIQGAHGGPIKIGKSTEDAIEGRLSSLQTGSPYPLVVRRVLLGDQEKALHGRFWKHRLSGEWFKPVAEIAKVAEALAGDGSEVVMGDVYAAGYADGYRAANEGLGELQAFVETTTQELHDLHEQIGHMTDDPHALSIRDAFGAHVRTLKSMRAKSEL